MNWLIVSQFLGEIETFTVTNEEVATRDKMKYVTWNVSFSDKLVGCNLFFFFSVGRLFYNVLFYTNKEREKCTMYILLMFTGQRYRKAQ